MTNEQIAKTLERAMEYKPGSRNHQAAAPLLLTIAELQARLAEAEAETETLRAQAQSELTRRQLDQPNQTQADDFDRGGRLPFGYQHDGELRVDEEQAAIVKTIFNLNDEGKSLRGTADALNEGGFRTPAGKKWSHTAVKYILDNHPVYQGKQPWKGHRLPKILNLGT
jgi:hypothetical protein